MNQLINQTLSGKTIL